MVSVFRFATKERSPAGAISLSPSVWVPSIEVVLQLVSLVVGTTRYIASSFWATSRIPFRLQSLPVGGAFFILGYFEDTLPPAIPTAWLVILVGSIARHRCFG